MTPHRQVRLTAAVAMALMVVLVAGCASLDRPRAQGETVVLPTPMRSLDASVASSVASLEGAVSAVGSRLEVPDRPYRPSEPQALLQVPRAVLRADLADPDEGFVVVYRAVDQAGAMALAAELAAYLGSGLGLTNYPAGTRISVAVLGDTVLFTTWSPSRSADASRAEAVFDALASVGQPVVDGG
jgi:hypothetical protein